LVNDSKREQERYSSLVHDSLRLTPLGEQCWIVANVEGPISLCYQMKSRLRDARDVNQQFMTTLTERTVD